MSIRQTIQTAERNLENDFRTLDWITFRFVFQDLFPNLPRKNGAAQSEVLSSKF